MSIRPARARQDSEAGRKLQAQRQGVEGTISQGVRAFGLRRARYRGLTKAGLQNVATAAAINLDRLAAWFAQRRSHPRGCHASPHSRHSRRLRQRYLHFRVVTPMGVSAPATL